VVRPDASAVLFDNLLTKRQSDPATGILREANIEMLGSFSSVSSFGVTLRTRRTFVIRSRDLHPNQSRADHQTFEAAPRGIQAWATVLLERDRYPKLLVWSFFIELLPSRRDLALYLTNSDASSRSSTLLAGRSGRVPPPLPIQRPPDKLT
jgi:hypothetical protein